MAVGFRRSIFAIVFERCGDVSQRQLLQTQGYFEGIPGGMNYDVYLVLRKLVGKVNCGCHFGWFSTASQPCDI